MTPLAWLAASLVVAADSGGGVPASVVCVRTQTAARAPSPDAAELTSALRARAPDQLVVRQCWPGESAAYRLTVTAMEDDQLALVVQGKGVHLEEMVSAQGLGPADVIRTLALKAVEMLRPARAGSTDDGLSGSAGTVEAEVEPAPLLPRTWALQVGLVGAVDVESGRIGGQLRAVLGRRLGAWDVGILANVSAPATAQRTEVSLQWWAFDAGLRAHARLGAFDAGLGVVTRRAQMKLTPGGGQSLDYWNVGATLFSVWWPIQERASEAGVEVRATMWFLSRRFLFEGQPLAAHPYVEVSVGLALQRWL